jgi:hypothetical protein
MRGFDGDVINTHRDINYRNCILASKYLWFAVWTWHSKTLISNKKLTFQRPILVRCMVWKIHHWVRWLSHSNLHFLNILNCSLFLWIDMAETCWNPIKNGINMDKPPISQLVDVFLPAVARALPPNAHPLRQPPVAAPPAAWPARPEKWPGGAVENGPLMDVWPMKHV